MAILTYTVTLSGATRAVTTVTPVASIRIENEASNALVKYGPSTVSATEYGGSVPADTATVTNAVTLGPFPMDAMDLSSLYFLGTDTQKIHITAVQI